MPVSWLHGHIPRLTITLTPRNAAGDSHEDVNVYGRAGPAWNERRRRHAADELGEEEHEQFDFDRERRFGQRTGGIQPQKGLYGHKSPSVASLVSTNTSFDADEDGLKFGMMETAGGQEPFRMTVVHSKILVLISKYGQISVNDEPETWIRELPLQVLVYEGITAGVFEMDYSPVLTPTCIRACAAANAQTASVGLLHVHVCMHVYMHARLGVKVSICAGLYDHQSWGRDQADVPQPQPGRQVVHRRTAREPPRLRPENHL